MAEKICKVEQNLANDLEESSEIFLLFSAYIKTSNTNTQAVKSIVATQGTQTNNKCVYNTFSTKKNLVFQHSL